MNLPGETTPEPAHAVMPEPAPAPAAPEAWAPPTTVAPVAPMPAVAPNEPVRSNGSGRVALIATSIALVGVLLSAVAGGSAGYLASQFNNRALGTGAPVSALPTASAAAEPIAAAAAVALPSVVNIDVTGASNASGLPGGHPAVPSGGTGSGVAYKAAPGGGTYIITNNHVVADASTIVVTPASGERMTATLVGTDPETDIAVVKVSAKLPIIAIGDSENLLVGQTTIAIGSPFGLQHSVSSGVVSALHRSITASSLDTSSSAYPLVDVIQTDAAINPGNSGGALVDRTGRLIGIDSAIYTDSGNSAGVGFAIPVRTATRIADELISGAKATHPFLGVEGQTVTSADASAAGLPTPDGALVASVIPNTGAAKAGITKGDIVTALNGSPIRTMNDLILAVRRSQVGDKVTLTVWRDKKSITVVMTVGDKPASLK